MRRVVLTALGLACAGCVAIRTHAHRPWTWTESRAHYIERSEVWLGGDVDSWVRHIRSLDLLAGPSRDDAFAPEDLVRCAFVEARPALAGTTPKFLCGRSSPRDPAARGGSASATASDTFLVKWGADTGEVYAEVASTRLLWALGFGADAVYPVRVECTGCADDPWRDRSPQPGHVPPVFAPAIIERKFPAPTIEDKPDQGWTWDELENIDPAAGGAPRAHVDALQLLAAFIQHRDSKAENQRLVCLPDGVTVAPDGRRDCTRPFMLIADLGSTFGGPARIFTHKMQLDAWRGEPVWRNPRRCVANVDDEPAARDGLDEPRISEEGRRFLATLLAALDDDQLTALFTAARADQRGGVANWVTAFKDRREQIDHPVPADPSFHCPDSR